MDSDSTCSSSGLSTPSASKKQKFSDTWLDNPDFAMWLEKCDDMYKARCKLCNKQLSVGISKLRRHKESMEHKSNEEYLKIVTMEQEASDIDKASTSSCNFTTQVKKAELRFCMDIVEHNRSFHSYGHFVKMLQKAIPDSQIVKNITLKRSKVCAMIRNVINKEIVLKHLDKLPTKYFSIHLDESTDISDTKNLCILVRYVEEGKICIYLLEYLRITDGTSENLFKCLQYALQKNKLDFNNLVGISVDNASVMIGRHNSLVSRLLAINKEVAVFPCTCHSVHLIACNATKCLPEEIINVVHKVYTYFSRSPIKQALLEETQQLLNISQAKLVKPCPTRWLALSESIHGILEQWYVLLGFFAEANLSQNNKAEYIFNTLNSKFTKAYLEFLNYALKKMVHFNLLFQSSKVLIHILLPECNRFLRFFGDAFLNPQCMREANLHNIDVENDDNLLPFEKIDLGQNAQRTIEDLKNDSDVSIEDITGFYNRIQKFYKVVYKEIRTRLPLNEEFLNSLEFINPTIAMYIENHKDQIQKILTKFPTKFDENSILTEWRELPSYFSPQEKDELCKLAIPEFWHKISLIKDFTDNYRFVNIARMASLCMSLPHSNAEVERFFSIISEIKTRDRNRLKTQMISALTRIKLDLRNQNKNCITWEISEKTLDLFNYKMYEKEDIPEHVAGIILPDGGDTDVSDTSDSDEA